MPKTKTVELELTINVRGSMSNTFPAMLRRLSKRFTPATVIDVGASDGRWSRMAHEIWPDANLLLIEANPCFWAQLSGFCTQVRTMSRSAIHACLLAWDKFSDHIPVRFNENPFQGIQDDEPNGIAQSAPIDWLVEQGVFPGPYLLKLDVHGREHEILSGAQQTLKNTGAIVAEVYTWSQGANSLRAMDLIPLIEREYGFLPSDLCEPMRRPFDGRLSQVDLLLEPKSAAGMDTARFK